jgi:hypothetical protein
LRNPGYPPAVGGGIDEESIRVSASWVASMQAALVATLANPEWWAMALAAFLVRGGILVVILPLVSLPTPASLVTIFAPPLEALILGSPTVEGIALGALGISLVLAALALLALAGSWLELVLVREAATDDELDLGWVPRRVSAVTALGLRLAAHLPTLFALAYAFARLAVATRDELLEPGDPSVAMTARVLLRAPDALALVLVAWLVGETVGALAARRRAAGAGSGAALSGAVRRSFDRRGLPTLLLTTAVLLGFAIPFALAVGRAWEHLIGALSQNVSFVQMGAGLLLLVSTWVLGLALLGAALAWRATAWTVLASPSDSSDPEAAPTTAREGAPG